MAVPPVLGDGRAHADVAAQLACAGLGEVSREDVAVTINGQSRDRVAHTDKIVSRNGYAPQGGVLSVDRRPGIRPQRDRAAAKCSDARVEDQP